MLFDVLANGKKWIIVSTALFALLTIGTSFLFTKFYSARISLYPSKQDLNSNLGQFQSLASNFGMNLPNEKQNFNKHKEIIEISNNPDFEYK